MNYRGVKKVGNECEKLALKFLKANGYWVHLFVSGKGGQPVDLIAFKGREILLLDVKHCDGERFYRSRVEVNQWTSMKYARSKSEYAKIGILAYSELSRKFSFIPYEVLLIEALSVELKSYEIDSI